MGSGASATYVGHGSIALVGADVTWRAVLTIAAVLALLGFMVPSEFYYGGGSGRTMQVEREIRHCTYTGQDYDTCFKQVTGN